MTAPRRTVLEAVAALVPPAPDDGGVRVAVDGVDGAGKTIFADELAAILAADRAVVRSGPGAPQRLTCPGDRSGY